MNTRKNNFQHFWKEIKLKRDVSYVPKYIFRNNKPLNNNRNLNAE